MFRTLYHVAPVLSRSSLDEATDSMVDLANLAEYYGCEQVIETAIHNHLHVFRTEIEERCARNPLEMLELAIKLKVDWIFMEAGTHLLGRSNIAFNRALPRLEELKVLDLMISKRSEFVKRLQECEFSLFKIQLPVGTQNSATQLALCYFRERLADQLGRGLGSGLEKGYSQIYRGIHSDALLPNSATHWQPMYEFLFSINCFGHPQLHSQVISAVQAIAELAEVVVRPVLEDKTRQKEKSSNLTCMEIKDDELPWMKK